MIGTPGEQASDSISAVVVAYNSGDALTECVVSLRSAGLSEIVMVDNGSSDGSVEKAAERAPDAKVIRTEHNLGFGGGVNRGVESTNNDLVLVCNSDVTVTATAVHALRARLVADHGAALVGPQLMDPSGRPQVSSRSFPTLRHSWRQAFAGVLAPGSRSARRYEASNQAIAARGGEVDWVTGACFLARASAFTSVGGFDPSYFMYVEEVDLCWRLHCAGWRILHEPSASVTHIGGASASKRPFAMVVAHHRSLWRFSRTTISGVDRLALPAVAIAIGCRAAIVILRQAWASLPSDRGGRRRTGASGP